jgi:cytochrome c
MGQGGMMGQGQGPMPNLKELPAERSVKSVRYCDRKYFVTTAGGDVLEFRDFDLRFKTDAGDQGPRRGAPALLPAGMMGDRAFLIFSDPGEISGYIEKECRDR